MELELSSGSRIASRFKVVGCLGTGDNGPVFLARDGSCDDREVALKVYHGRYINRDNRGQTCRSMQEISEISSSAIVRSLEFVDSKECQALVMEHIEGESLSNIIEDRGLTKTEVVQLLIDLCSFFEPLHAQGFAHCDLTLKHILIEFGGQIRILGLPQRIGTQLLSQFPISISIGNAHYKPSEFLKSGIVTPQNDIYALGVIGTELIGTARTESAIDKQVDRLFLPLIERARETNQKRSYANISEFKDALLVRCGKFRTTLVPAWAFVLSCSLLSIVIALSLATFAGK